MFKKSNRKKIIGEFCHIFQDNCKIGTKINDINVIEGIKNILEGDEPDKGRFLNNYLKENPIPLGFIYLDGKSIFYHILQLMRQKKITIEDGDACISTLAKRRNKNRSLISDNDIKIEIRKSLSLKGKTIIDIDEVDYYVLKFIFDNILETGRIKGIIRSMSYELILFENFYKWDLAKTLYELWSGKLYENFVLDFYLKHKKNFFYEYDMKKLLNTVKIEEKGIFQYLVDSIVRRVRTANRLDLLEENYSAAKSYLNVLKEYGFEVIENDFQNEINKIKSKIRKEEDLDDYDYYAMKFVLEVNPDVKALIESMRQRNKLTDYTYNVFKFVVREIESDMMVKRMKSNIDSDISKTVQVQETSLALHIGNILKLRRGPKELDNLLKRKKHVYKSLKALLNRVKIDGVKLFEYIGALIDSRVRKGGRMRLFRESYIKINISTAREYLGVLRKYGLKVDEQKFTQLRNNKKIRT